MGLLDAGSSVWRLRQSATSLLFERRTISLGDWVVLSHQSYGKCRGMPQVLALGPRRAP